MLEVYSFPFNKVNRLQPGRSASAQDDGVYGAKPCLKLAATKDEACGGYGWRLRLLAPVIRSDGFTMLRRSQLNRLTQPETFLWSTGIEDTFITDPWPGTGRTLDEYELT